MGVAPVFCGLGFLYTTILYSHFKFIDFPNSLMTLFYIMLGDTLFDTTEGINQVNVFYTFMLTYAWIWFGNNIIMNITLA